MATTATKKQSAAIRERMQQIRNDLPYSMDVARDEVRNLTDWKYYVRSYPAIVLPAIAGVAYLLVPAPKPTKTVQYVRAIKDQAGDKIKLESAQPEKKSIIAGIVSAVVALGIRSATSFATKQVSQMFSDSSSPAFGRFKHNAPH